MPTTRIAYEQLPGVVRAAVAERIGSGVTAVSVTDGLNSAVAARLLTTGGAYFVKALPTDHRWVFTQRREADLAVHVRPVAAALVAHIVAHGWDVLIFEALDGHTADYRPGSPDLPKVADLLRRIGQLPCPRTGVRDAAQRLSDYVTRPDDTRYFTGTTLLHTDLNCANVLVGDRARIVDWGWATQGAGWLDAAHWALWLIAYGHDANSAEQWARRVPAWHTAPPAGVTAFVDAMVRLWDEINNSNADPFHVRLAAAAHRWQHARRP